MSSVDDLLFEPIHSARSWRDQCRAIIAYIDKNGELYRPMKNILDKNRPRPSGALFLEDLMELYHDGGQREFYYVIVGKQTKSVFTMHFDGTIIFGKYEDGNVPILGAFDGRRSIRDLNLCPPNNTYTRHYVFPTQDHARNYLAYLG